MSAVYEERSVYTVSKCESRISYFPNNQMNAIIYLFLIGHAHKFLLWLDHDGHWKDRGVHGGRYITTARMWLTDRSVASLDG